MLGEGMRVADLGAGSGAYTFAAAAIVGDTGRVFAVDVQKDLLSRIKNTAKGNGLYNIEVIWGNSEKLGGTKLREASIDVVIAANILFQIEHKEDFLNEIKRILKMRGKALVVDWSGSFGGMGPHPQALVTEEKAKELFESAGLSYEKTINAGEHHYGLIFRRT
jgi:ubiquinone/menaquinone biosynthesis C-methylase UbiE